MKSPSVRLVSNFSKYFSFEGNYQVNKVKNYADKLLMSDVIQQTYLVKVAIYPTEKTFLGYTQEFYKNDFVSTSSINSFSDLLFRYTPKKRKVDFELMCNNLFDSKQLQMVASSVTIYTESTYQLRPRQLMVKVSFPFS